MAPTFTPGSEQTDSTNSNQFKDQWVPETRFGKWFLSTEWWSVFVLKEAIADLHQLAGKRLPANPVLLDVGCGQGASFPLLEQYFAPQSICAVDVDPALLKVAELSGENCRCEVGVHLGSVKKLDIPDDTFDMIFCHQLIHHISFRELAMAEIYRVLKPGGLLLLSESCQHFLHVYWVAWLFRHPKMEQKTAEGYIDLVKDAGFELTGSDVLESTPWWSKRDFGLLRKWGLPSSEPKTTEISLVAIKPE
ncbi:MAG: class I SAM-dependent methyltransferase [Gammaproteobacteria bacterium]|nr:class I SAM-dependent methyltransferase [Gammaproteobacteria bacterium]